MAEQQDAPAAPGTLPRLGFAGLGGMGSRMALRLRRAGYPLAVYNRTPAKARPLADAGARVAASPADLAGQSDVVLLSLTDDAAVRTVLTGPGGVLAGARPGLIVVDLSTVGPATSRELAAACQAQGVRHLDAPVSGTRGPAEQGTLTIMVGGDAATVDAVRDVLGVLGSRLHHVGPSGQGSAMKLVMNLTLGLAMAALAEGLALGEGLGLTPAAMLDLLSRGPVGGLAQGKGPNLLARRYPTAFAVWLMAKDLGLCLTAGRDAGVPLPSTALAAQLYAAAAARRTADGQEDDFSAVYELVRSLGASAVSRAPEN